MKILYYAGLCIWFIYVIYSSQNNGRSNPILAKGLRGTIYFCVFTGYMFLSQYFVASRLIAASMGLLVILGTVLVIYLLEYYKLMNKEESFFGCIPLLYLYDLLIRYTDSFSELMLITVLLAILITLTTVHFNKIVTTKYVYLSLAVLVISILGFQLVCSRFILREIQSHTGIMLFLMIVVYTIKSKNIYAGKRFSGIVIAVPVIVLSVLFSLGGSLNLYQHGKPGAETMTLLEDMGYKHEQVIDLYISSRERVDRFSTIEVSVYIEESESERSDLTVEYYGGKVKLLDKK